MACSYEVEKYLIKNSVLFTPAKASIVGGDSTSAIEMSQNILEMIIHLKKLNIN